jgi:hypothetical protein
LIAEKDLRVETYFPGTGMPLLFSATLSNSSGVNIRLAVNVIPAVLPARAIAPRMCGGQRPNHGLLAVTFSLFGFIIANLGEEFRAAAIHSYAHRKGPDPRRNRSARFVQLPCASHKSPARTASLYAVWDGDTLIYCREFEKTAGEMDLLRDSRVKRLDA